MAAQPRNRLLTFNDPHPMRIDRDLAKEIGLNESIMLLQLEYLISISNNEREGRIWTYQSLTGLRKDYFPWWSMMTISRTIRNLENKHLIIIGNFNKLGYDRTQWFSLNEEGINSLHSVAIYQNGKCISQNGTSIYHFDEMDHTKMVNGSYQNDTTIPESTQRLPESTPSPTAVPKSEVKRNPDREMVMMLMKKGVKSQKVANEIATMGLDLATVEQSIDNMLHDPKTQIGAVIDFLRAQPPETGTPYPRSPNRKSGERVAQTVNIAKPSPPADAVPAHEAARRMLALRNPQKGSFDD